MASSISKRNTEQVSTANPFGNPHPGDKSLGIEIDVCFYEIEDGDKTEEGEDA